MGKIIKVLHGGTLGDAFSAHCRAEKLHELYDVDFEITRASRPENVYFDKSISEFYSLIPWIKYNGSRTDVIREYENRELRPSLKSLGYEIVMLTRQSFIGMFPKYNGPNCFPYIQTPDFGRYGKYIVVQLQGGKYNAPHGEMRGFSIESLHTIRNFFRGYTIYLIGTGNKYMYGDFNFDSIDGIVNLVGRTSLIEAMSLIQGADILIGFDGFFTFFAPSQRVKTIHFSHLHFNGRMSFDPIDDACGCWFDYSFMIRPVVCGRVFNLDNNLLYIAVDNLISKNGGRIV